MTFRVRVERGVKGAPECAHLVAAPSPRFRAPPREGRASPAATNDLREEREQGAVVVEHFLEVRDHPDRVDRSSG
jgi:hypothetical protein